MDTSKPDWEDRYGGRCPHANRAGCRYRQPLWRAQADGAGGPIGELIIDYSVYDALQAGFSRVVFVVKEEMEEAFRTKVGERSKPSVIPAMCSEAGGCTSGVR